MFIWYRYSGRTIIYLSDVPFSSKPDTVSIWRWDRGISQFLAKRRCCGIGFGIVYPARQPERSIASQAPGYSCLVSHFPSLKGILTSVTYRTYPSLHVAAAVIVIKTVSANTTQALFTEFLCKREPRWAARVGGQSRSPELCEFRYHYPDHWMMNVTM